MVRYILKCCEMVWRVESVYRNVLYLYNFDVILICKKKLGFMLYDVLFLVKMSNIYGVFYKYMKCFKVYVIIGNVFVWNSDGIWDNYGWGFFWYIFRWDIFESKVFVGIVYLVVCRKVYYVLGIYEVWKNLMYM